MLANSTYLGNAVEPDAPGARTTEVVYGVVLPEMPPEAGLPLVSRAPVLGCDLANFYAATLTGGSIEIFDGTGRSARLAFRWGQLVAPGNTPVSVWGLFYRLRSRPAFSEAAWRHTGREYRFTSPRCVESAWPYDLHGTVIDGVNFGTIRINHGRNGVALLPDGFGLVRITAFVQDGTPPAEEDGTQLN